jgi:hypothetical protein
MDDLLSGAETAFLDRNLDLARVAYGPLLKAFERHAEGFCGPEEPEHMLSTDVSEAKARYLRAVYETTPLSDRLACELLLLAGRIGSAVDCLSAAAPLGWQARNHPGPIVVPYLLVAATGIGGPPRPEESLLAQAFEQLDVHGWVDAGDHRYVAFGDEVEQSLIDSRFRSIDRDELLPSCLLAATLTRHPSSAAERTRWLAIARGAVEERVAGVVDGKHRGAYQRVARVAVACAEAIALANGQNAGAAWLDRVRARYQSHYAFRAEVDAAARESPILPSPVATRRR